MFVPEQAMSVPEQTMSISKLPVPEQTVFYWLFVCLFVCFGTDHFWFNVCSGTDIFLLFVCSGTDNFNLIDIVCSETNSV